MIKVTGWIRALPRELGVIPKLKPVIMNIATTTTITYMIMFTTNKDRVNQCTYNELNYPINLNLDVRIFLLSLSTSHHAVLCGKVMVEVATESWGETAISCWSRTLDSYPTSRVDKIPKRKIFLEF